MRIAALVIAAQLCGCTLVGGTIGGISGHSANAEHRAKKEPEDASTGSRILFGALLGLIVDGIIVNQAMKDCCPDFSGFQTKH